MEADMRDTEDGGSRYAGGQDQGYWARKRRQCTTRRNGTGGFEGTLPPPEERSEEVGYIVIVVSVSFGGQEATWSYAYACPPEPRRRCILSVVEA